MLHKHKNHRKRKLLRKKKKLRVSKDNRKLVSGMSGASSSGSKSASTDQKLEKFQFLPGYAGMPFPPFMMNGTHFHPPLNVTVNAIPNRDSKRELNPYEIEEENLKNQQNAMEPLQNQMKEIIEQMQNVNGETNVDLADQYEKIKNLYG